MQPTLLPVEKIALTNRRTRSLLEEMLTNEEIRRDDKAMSDGAYRQIIPEYPSVTGISSIECAAEWACALAAENPGVAFVVWNRTHNGDYCVFEQGWYNIHISGKPNGFGRGWLVATIRDSERI